MSGPTGSTPKICVHCGQDCSARPRVKDPQGHYACRECLERLAPVPAAAPPADPPPDDGAIDLDWASTAAKDVACPACVRKMPADAIVCANCGYNKVTGFQPGAGVGATDKKPGILKCTKCGYDMTGLKSPRCPECGTVVHAPTRKEESRDRSRKAARHEYIKPLIMIGIGLLGSVIFLAAWGGDEEVMKLFFLRYAVAVPAGLIAFAILGFMWMGFNAPFHLMALQLAAIYAVTDLVGAVLLMIPSFNLLLIRMILTGFVYLGLLLDLMELDPEDAIAFAVASVLVQIFVVSPIVAQLVS